MRYARRTTMPQSLLHEMTLQNLGERRAGKLLVREGMMEGKAKAAVGNQIGLVEIEPSLLAKGAIINPRQAGAV